MLQLKNLSKIYRTQFVETNALKEINLHVEEGEFVAVTGPSGSGKTTFLNIVGMLENFDEGECLLDGQSMRGLSDRELSRIRNEKIGFIFQGFNLIPELNLRDNVEIPLRYRKVAAGERKHRVEEVLEMLGLSKRARHYPAQLSGGQQQRVAIARALAGNPRFLLADEPTGNLDTAMAEQVMSTLEQINRGGTTIIMVTHSSELAVRAHRNIHILDGRIQKDIPRVNIEQSKLEAPHAGI